jgi:short-subunit dehydrogenase
LWGIDVIVIGPGAVSTPIWSKAEQIDTTPFRNSPYALALDRLRAYMLKLGENGLPPERVGEVVLQALTAAKPKVRYAITPNPVRDWIMRNLPKRFIDRMIGKRLGLLPKR